MQAATRPYASPPHTLYHNPFQPGPQDRELKRQYLALLPPQQIIDICLTFDVHVPPYIRSTVWPLDINAAIAALSKKPHPPDCTPPDDRREADNVPVMDSLKDLEQDKQDKTATEQGQPSAAAAIQSEPSTPSSDNAGAQHPPAQSQQASHPYAYPGPAAYPHAPYYPPPSAPYTLHPHPSYTGYPFPPGSYPVTPVGYPQSSYPNPSVPHTPQLTDPYNTHAGDDLPSYEEMIVEALMESNDPEGCAPKDLFTWMASHYPLQSNFRPSASQALQKAFKRGRFEKTNGGKYRLSTTWEGGSTSRRTTRRPQTISQSTASNISPLPPPFTQTPLIHQNSHSAGTRTPYLGQPFAYQYAPVPPGYLPYSSLPNPHHATTTGPTSADNHSSTVDKEEKDAYETAQNILRAINFGNLLEMSNEKDDTSGESTVNPTTSECQRSSAVTGTEASRSAPPPIISGENETPGSGIVVTTRAQLRAQFALLATQLADIAEEQARAASENGDMAIT